MKLKMLLLAVFAAGLAASMALAGDGKKHDNGKGSDCSEVHLSGTIAAQSLAVTLDRASKSGLAAGSTVTLALGGAGQTVRVNVEACNMATTGSAAQLSVRGLELRVRAAQTQTGTTGTTTGKKHDDEHGDHEHHKGATTTGTTATTATVATSTVGTTTHG